MPSSPDHDAPVANPMASSEPEGSLAPLLEPRPLFIDAAPSSRQSSRSTPPSPLKLSRPFTQRSQSLSHTRPDLDDFAPSDEQTPLLSHVPSQTFDASAREWTQALKRRSAVLSDLLSARNHSGVVLPPGSADQEEDQEEFGGAEIDRRPSDLGGGSLRGWGSRRSGGRPKGYDGEFRQELEGEGGNGVRSWYASYAAIDWIHDGVKEDVRKRKLRRRKRDEGIRGWLVNFWDGSQGWLLVTIVGECETGLSSCARKLTSCERLRDGLGRVLHYQKRDAPLRPQGRLLFDQPAPRQALLLRYRRGHRRQTARDVERSPRHWSHERMARTSSSWGRGQDR